MKNLKWGILAFFAGEFLTLWHRDKGFQKKVKKEKNRSQKLKIAFHGLVNFNKELWSEAKQIDVQEHAQQAKLFVEEEFAQLKSKLYTLEQDWKSMTAAKVKTLLSDLEGQYHVYLDKAKTFSQEMKEKYAINEKIDEVTALLDKLKKKKID